MSVAPYRLGWTTDVHLDHAYLVDDNGVRTFGRKLAALDLDALVITGDIGVAETTEARLNELQVALGKPIYFVLGNHDIYGSSVAAIRDDYEKRTKSREWNRQLTYLSIRDPIEISPGYALVGEDGWYDGRNGNLNTTTVELADFDHVFDLRAVLAHEMYKSPSYLVRVLAQLGDDAAARAKAKLTKAFRSFEKVIFATHVPPFIESAYYRGAPDLHWLPFMSSRAMGEMLLKLMKSHQNKKLLVLCGHVHSSNNYEPLPNLRVVTGAAQYRFPALNRVIEIGGVDNNDTPTTIAV